MTSPLNLTVAAVSLDISHINQMKNNWTLSKNDAGYAGLAFSQEQKSRMYVELVHYSNLPLL